MEENKEIAAIAPMAVVKKNLYQRISAVMSDVRYLQKDDTVGSGNYGYKAISIEKVVESVRSSLIEHGLVILPVGQVHTMEDKQRTNNKGELVIVPITTVDAKYKIVNIDNPEEFEILTSSGTGVDPQDKGVGKAMTYSYKNMIIRTFAIPTGDDTDKTHNKDLEAQQNRTASKAPAKQANVQESGTERSITAEQKQEVLNLLKNPAQTEADIKKVTGKLDGLNYEQALQTIVYLKKQIAKAAAPQAKEASHAS